MAALPDRSSVVEVSLSEAASRLGVSVDTVRRRLKSGELAGRQVGRRTLVSLPDGARRPERRTEDALLAEVRADRDRLAAMVDTLLRQLDAALDLARERRPRG